MTASIGVVCGLASEAAAIRRAFASVEGAPPHAVLVTGANAAQAEHAAQRLLDNGAEHLMSVGLCGGLDPSLRTGDVVLATAVLSAAQQDISWNCDTLAEGLLADWRRGAVLAVDEAITAVAEKEVAFTRTGALAVDMESHAVMRVASRGGRPASVLRVVVDEAATALPSFVGEITAPSGHPRLVGLAGWLLRRPGDLSSFVSLARASGTAHRSLRTAVAQLAKSLTGAGERETP